MKIVTILALCVSVLIASVDFNTANEKELSALKGIGPSKAKAIMNYRKTNCLKTIEQIVNVKGIGQKTLEKNIKNIRVSECK